MAKRNKPQTWLEVAILNAGLRTAVKAALWAHQWAVAREALGHEPTAEEVAEWWKQPERSAYRDQAAFRKAFPTLDSPAKIYESDEARASAASTARLAEDIEKWRKDRKAARELDAMKAFMFQATP